MIEFAILFGLGFLAASLLMLMLAPAIQKRIVAYTEKRLFATMPISPSEVRAQKDMAKALYAAENARLRQELEDERQRSISLRVRHDEETIFHRTIENRTQELQTQVTTLETEISSLQDHLQTKQKENQELASKLQISEDVAKERAKEINLLSGKVKQISRDLDEVKIQLASRSIEVEQEKTKARNFKSERDAMSKDLINAEAQNKAAAEKITRESRRATLLEQRLADSSQKDATSESLLERRAGEIARLKERLRAATTHVSGKGSGALVADEAYSHETGEKLSDESMTTSDFSTALSETDFDEIEDIRARSASLTDRLIGLKDKTEDQQLREEIAALAAQMVALTAKREGQSSPIHKLLDQSSGAEPDSSLASRAKRALETQGL